ncbi:MAG: NAD+ synthase [Microbacteriaceae bacterium]
MPNVRLAMVQTNPTVGDISGNLVQILNACQESAKAGATLVVTGEMALTGYPIEDLATRASFVASAESAVQLLAERLQSAGLGALTVVVGHPKIAKDAQQSGWAIANNYASVVENGKVVGGYAKHHLPNYSVFDEYRNFVAGESPFSFEHHGLRVGILICEDIWQRGSVVESLDAQACDLTLVLNGSPFEIDKDDRRLSLTQDLAKRHDTHVAYVNLVGGQDDLVFDGGSFVVDRHGNLVDQAEQFKEAQRILDVSKETVTPLQPATATETSTDWQIWNALVLGLRDYCNKNGFKSVVLGLSGGIDSAVCATLAADAIGATNVYGVSLPSKYSSDHSKGDAEDLAERLGLNFSTVAIEPMVQAFETNLDLGGVASENLQARVRGVILMGLSNSDGHLTLTTGNKTELAVGYSTIYGDSVGGFAPIKDVEKTLVWRLAKWRNEFALEQGQVAPIPENSILKPPSAELRPDQTDQDTLPEYELLDEILRLYVGKQESAAQIISHGFDSAVVNRIVSLVDRAEWKRRQSAIGPKITGMAFGRDRRLPVTNKSKE